MQSTAIFFRAQGAVAHQLASGSKKKLGSGQITFEHDKQGFTIVRIGDFNRCITKLEMGLKNYEDSISYFYLCPETRKKIFVISVSTIENSPEKIEEFKHRMEYDAKPEPLEQKQDLLIQLGLCYKNWEKEFKTGFTKAAKSLGEVVGKVSEPITEMEEKVNTKMHGPTHKINESVLREKSHDVNMKVTEKIQPGTDKVKNTSNSVARGFNESENSAVKAVRDFGQKTKSALNQGYEQGYNEKAEHK